jgi:tetratricopeptide (TPR) repeat protein
MHISGLVAPQDSTVGPALATSVLGPQVGSWLRRRSPVLRTALRGCLLAGLVILTARNLARREVLYEAEAAYRRGDFLTALRRATDYLDRSPPSAPAARVAALCLSRLDFADLAEPYYLRAGQLGLDELHIRAYGLVRGNRRHEAEAAYRQILARFPDNPLALRRLGAELLTMMRWDEALQLAERLVQTPGGELDGLAMVGAIQHHNDKDAAVLAFRRVLEIDPQLSRFSRAPEFRQVFWTQLTEDFMATGRSREARRMLERAPPDDRGPKLTWLMGRLFYREGSFDEADRCWSEAVRADPGLTDAWIDLGRLAMARNRPEEAIAPLQKASALEPRAYAPAYHLSLAYRRLGQKDLAERCHARAEKLRRVPVPEAVENASTATLPLSLTP